MERRRGGCVLYSDGSWIFFFVEFLFSFSASWKSQKIGKPKLSLFSHFYRVYILITPWLFWPFRNLRECQPPWFVVRGKKTTFFKKLRWVVSSFQFQMTRAFRLLLAGPSSYQKKTQLSPSGISYHLHSRLLRDSTKSSGTTSRDMLWGAQSGLWQTSFCVVGLTPYIGWQLLHRVLESVNGSNLQFLIG
jgi:hypothetical protein